MFTRYVLNSFKQFELSVLEFVKLWVGMQMIDYVAQSDKCSIYVELEVLK